MSVDNDDCPTNQEAGGVSIDKIEGGISHSIFAGGNVYVTKVEYLPPFMGAPALPTQLLVGRDELMATLVAKLTPGKPWLSWSTSKQK